MIYVYNGISQQHSVINGTGVLSELVPDIDFSHAVILKNGERLTADYNVQSEDIIFIRRTPAAATAVVAVVTAVVVVAGVALGLYLKKKKDETMDFNLANRNSKNLSSSVDRLAFLRGAKNKSAYGNAIQYVMGSVLNTPYLLTDGYYSIGGTKGDTQYWTAVLCLGYGRQVVSKMQIGTELFQEWSTAIPQEGTFGSKPGTLYHNAANIIEIAQGGNLTNPAFTRKVKCAQYGDEIKHDYGAAAVPLIKQLAANAMSAEICVQFQGLRKFNNDTGNWEATSVTINPYWTNDNGTTWHAFTFTGGNIFRENASKTVRYVAAISFTKEQAYGKTISIKLVRENQKNESNSNEDAYLLFINTFCYDASKSRDAAALIPCALLEPPYNENTAKIGVRIIADENSTDTLDEINIECCGIARVWNGTAWSAGKVMTRNPAAWIVELLTSDVHPHSRFSDAELEMDSFGELYEICEREAFYTDGIITSPTKKATILQKILEAVNADIIINSQGRLEIAIDKKETYPIALLNSQSIISATVAKTFERKPDGIKVQFTNRESWQNDAFYTMLDGEEKTAEDVCTEATLEYVTTHAHAWKIAQRRLRVQQLQPRVVSVQVGKDGDYYPLYSVVMLQLEQLRQGIRSAVIHRVIQDAAGYITALDISDAVQFETGSRYGVIIQAMTREGMRHIQSEVTGSGKTRRLTFKAPLVPTGILPQTGNILSFGYINDDGSFYRVTNLMKITARTAAESGWTLELKDYNEALYEYGAIPPYTSNLTSPMAPARTIPPLTMLDISNAIAAVKAGTDGDTPAMPQALTAEAQEDGIQFYCTAAAAGLANTIARYVFALSKDNGSTWKEYTSTNNLFVYTFVRNPATDESEILQTPDGLPDGYPEAADFSAWRARVKVINLYGRESEYTPAAQVTTATYGTWQLDAPTLTVQASNRSVLITATQPARADGRPRYGTIRQLVQIRRTDTDTIDGEPVWYKPAQDTDPYTAETAYRTGNAFSDSSIPTQETAAVISGSFSQTLPLAGQNDEPPAPTYTAYQARVCSFNETAKSAYSIVTATARPTSCYDVVKGWEVNEAGEKVKVDGALGADRIYAESLAAISVNLGAITAGNLHSELAAGETSPAVLLDLDGEEFRVGNAPSLEKADSVAAEYLHWIKGQGLFIKLKNFLLDTIGAVIKGTLTVISATNDHLRTVISHAGFEVEEYNTGTQLWETTGKMTKDVYGNMVISNDPATIKPYNLPPPAGACIYQLAEHTKDLNDGNAANLTFFDAAFSMLDTPFKTQGALSGTLAVPIAENHERNAFAPSTGRLTYTIQVASYTNLAATAALVAADLKLQDKTKTNCDAVREEWDRRNGGVASATIAGGWVMKDINIPDKWLADQYMRELDSAGFNAVLWTWDYYATDGTNRYWHPAILSAREYPLTDAAANYISMCTGIKGSGTLTATAQAQNLLKRLPLTIAQAQSESEKLTLKTKYEETGATVLQTPDIPTYYRHTITAAVSLSDETAAKIAQYLNFTDIKKESEDDETIISATDQVRTLFESTATPFALEDYALVGAQTDYTGKMFAPSAGTGTLTTSELALYLAAADIQFTQDEFVCIPQYYAEVQDDTYKRYGFFFKGEIAAFSQTIVNCDTWHYAVAIPNAAENTLVLYVYNALTAELEENFIISPQPSFTANPLDFSELRASGKLSSFYADGNTAPIDETLKEHIINRYTFGTDFAIGSQNYLIVNAIDPNRVISNAFVTKKEWEKIAGGGTTDDDTDDGSFASQLAGVQKQLPSFATKAALDDTTAALAVTNEAVNAAVSAITAETAARTEADIAQAKTLATLESAISAEATARTENDTETAAALESLRADLMQEATDRESVCTIALEAVTTQSAQITALESALTAESTARAENDTAQTETDRLQSEAIVALENALTTETQQRTENDTETAAALEAVHTLVESMTTSTEIDTLQNAISNENTARQDADTELRNALTAAENSISTLESALTAETTARTETDSAQTENLAALESALTAETTARTEADMQNLEAAQSALDTLHTQLQELTKSLGVLDKNFTRYNPMPIGAVYVQLPFQNTPAELFGGEWDNISELYAGSFFRAEGGNAAPFEQYQDGQIQAHSHELDSRNWNWNAETPEQTADGINFQFGGFRANQNEKTQNTGGTETRPENYAVKIWKRSA